METYIGIISYLVGTGIIVLLIMSIIWAAFKLGKKIRDAVEELFPEEGE